MRRPLGNMEAALQVTGHFAPMSVAGVVRLRNGPDQDHVRWALDVMQRRHPLLRARIITKRRKPFFDVSPDVPPIPLEVIHVEDHAQWRDVATQIINRNLDVETGPLLACTYLHERNAQQGDLIFAHDHSIMDAASAGRTYDQILSLCGGLIGPDDLPPLPLPPSIDQLLPDRLTGISRIAPLGRFIGRQSTDEFAFRRNVRGRVPQVQPEARCVTLTRTLDADATHDLVHDARDHLLTTNSVVAAALLEATYQNLYASESLPMRSITFADLRPELRPTPSADVLGCYVSMLRHTVHISSDDDLWTIALRVQNQIRRSMAADEPLLSAGMAKQMMKLTIAMKRDRMATTAVSYAGPVAMAENYGDIEVTAVHGFISNNRLGPIATAFATIFRDSLTWDFVFLDTDMDLSMAEQIADSTIDNLRTAGIR